LKGRHSAATAAIWARREQAIDGSPRGAFLRDRIKFQDPISIGSFFSDSFRVFAGRRVSADAPSERGDWRAENDDDEHYVYAIALL